MKNSKIENDNQHDMIHLTKVQNHDKRMCKWKTKIQNIFESYT